MGKEIWVLIEHSKGEIQEGSLEVLTEAKRLSAKLDASVACFVLGKNVHELCEHLGPYGADSIYLFEHPELEHYTTDGYMMVLSEALQNPKVIAFLIAGTTLGRDLAPRLSTRLKAGLLTDCTVLGVNQGGELEFSRPAYGGRVYATYTCPQAALQVATIRPGVLGTGQPMRGRTAEVTKMEVDLDPEMIRTKILGYSKVDRENLDITEAEVVLAFGRGLEEGSNLAGIDRLAQLIDAALGGSRAAVDEGWVPFERQIGQTGKTIASELIMCCGISGAQQFTMGMRDSKFIVALNKDPYAPIFKIADISVLGDMHEIIPLLIERLVKIKESKTENSKI
ncbi:electron transfer flavoprotein subunit alpha/FixB family protein [Thermodesulfobacteriota bacterium]